MQLAKSDGLTGIILITDGMETCHGNPAEEAAKLAKNPKFTFGLRVIGFDVDPKEREAVEEIAKAGKGKYYSVANATELSKVLQEVDKTIKAPPERPVVKDRENRGVKLEGVADKPGVFLGDAPVVKPGKFTGALPFMGTDYRQVAVRKGQELRVIGEVQKTSYEASNSNIHQTFTMTIYDSNLAVVAREKKLVEGNTTTMNNFRVTWTVPADGMVYVAIAASDNHGQEGHPVSLYGNLNPKPSPYTLTIKVDGEAAATGAPQPLARSETKAGNGLGEAGELADPSLTTTDLKLGEVVFYRVNVKKGDPLQASAAFAKPWYNAGNGNIKATYILTLYDDDHVQMAQKRWPSG